MNSSHPTMAPRPRAVVTDAGERVALHVIRALGRAGIDVVAIEARERSHRSPGHASRFASGRLVLNMPDGAADWATALLAIGRDGDVLMPSCFNSLLSIVQDIQTIGSRYLTLVPHEEALLRANDKWNMHDLGEHLGIPTPVTWKPSDAVELQRLTEAVEYPVIVKFRHDMDLYLGPGERYALAASPSALQEVWHRFHEVQSRPLVQQFVAGESYGFEALYDREHRCVASFQHRRLVECPPQGGPSAVCESVRVAELEEYGRRLLDELKWTGVAMVEFRRCAITGRFYLLEINPRFWGSVALSEAAGVNFPALYYRCARGEKVEAPTYREGVRLRLMPTYLVSGLMSMRRGPRGIWEALSNLRYLFDPRVREGLITLDDLSGSWAYIRRKIARGSTDG